MTFFRETFYGWDGSDYKYKDVYMIAIVINCLIIAGIAYTVAIVFSIIKFIYKKYHFPFFIAYSYRCLINEILLSPEDVILISNPVD